ncbi:RidA family protein [Rhizohabitans arisaemae]|uniref:RidA family protein n=1 Tax=Rhizohabitans arisaemae TaxID=2720610 RepID=UPI0024B09496|nr:RidA family protein [Rhizohabitans arisaemae]
MRRTDYAGPVEKGRHYSKAVKVTGGSTVYLAGQTYPVEQGKSIPDFTTQATWIFERIDETLRAAGGSIENMVTMTVFVTDGRHVPLLHDIRRNHFPTDNRPCSAVITVHSLPQPGMLLEVQGVAVLPD